MRWTETSSNWLWTSQRSWRSRRLISARAEKSSPVFALAASWVFESSDFNDETKSSSARGGSGAGVPGSGTDTTLRADLRGMSAGSEVA